VLARHRRERHDLEEHLAIDEPEACRIDGSPHTLASVVRHGEMVAPTRFGSASAAPEP
jgi:hypothetical protein